GPGADPRRGRPACTPTTQLSSCPAWRRWHRRASGRGAGPSPPAGLDPRAARGREARHQGRTPPPGSRPQDHGRWERARAWFRPGVRTGGPGALAEGERESLSAGVGEGDLEGAGGNGPGLADELVQPLLAGGAAALAVHIGSLGGARRLPVE